MRSGWARVAIGDVARIVSGATPKTSVPEYWDGNVPWATPKDLSRLASKVLSRTGRMITSAGLASCAAEVLPAGSVLLSSRAPIGLVAINARPMATNQGFKSLVPGARLDSSYLYWWLRTHRSSLEALGNGATFKEISKATVQRVEIPLPPFDEQRRIAAVLDRVDVLRTKRFLALRAYSTLPDILLESMARSGWPKMRFGDVVKEIIAGRNIIAPEGTAAHPDFRVLPVGAVTFGQFRPDALKPVPASYSPPAKHLVAVGDLLFGRANTAELVGAVAIADEVRTGTLLPDKIWRIEERSECVDRAYLRFAMGSSSFRNEVRRRASGTSASMKNISKQKLVEIPVLVPPMEVQLEFSAKVSRIGMARSAAVRHLGELDTLFVSLQSRAFAGELDVSKVALPSGA